MERNTIPVIPALNPDKTLIDYVQNLIANGFKRVIVVDDGSCPEKESVFESINSMPECEVLRHAVNLGKGRALKDAFNHYCCMYSKDFSGVITIDSDGQHSLEDVLKLDYELGLNPEKLILGVRDFDDPSVPFKSRIGNKITRIIMKFFIGGVFLSDTQTGLRGIPNQGLSSCLTMFGERFEYETNMLIEAVHKNVPIMEIPIKTVYINGNKETHFRPIVDSIAIYSLILSTFVKYILSSLSSFLVDYAAFCIIRFVLISVTAGYRIWISTIVARILSSAYNYVINKKLVFQRSRNQNHSFFKYYILCTAQLCWVF